MPVVLPRLPDVMPDVMLVALGGIAGTAARAALGLAVDDVGGVPTTIGAINLLGAAALGVLVGGLGAATRAGGMRAERARRMRLLLGTGLLGGFTTYSAVSVDIVMLWETRPGAAIAYATTSLLAGLALAAVGMRAGRAMQRRFGSGSAPTR